MRWRVCFLCVSISRMKVEKQKSQSHAALTTHFQVLCGKARAESKKNTQRTAEYRARHCTSWRHQRCAGCSSVAHFFCFANEGGERKERRKGCSGIEELVPELVVEEDGLEGGGDAGHGEDALDGLCAGPDDVGGEDDGDVGGGHHVAGGVAGDVAEEADRVVEEDAVVGRCGAEAGDEARGLGGVGAVLALDHDDVVVERERDERLGHLAEEHLEDVRGAVHRERAQARGVARVLAAVKVRLELLRLLHAGRDAEEALRVEVRAHVVAEHLDRARHGPQALLAQQQRRQVRAKDLRPRRPSSPVLQQRAQLRHNRCTLPCRCCSHNSRKVRSS